MSRRRTGLQPGQWVDEGPRSPAPTGVGWSLRASHEPSQSSRARGRDIESGDYRDYQLRETVSA